MKTDKERIATLEAQLKFLTPMIERTDKNVVQLLENQALARGKFIGFSIALSFVASILGHKIAKLFS